MQGTSGSEQSLKLPPDTIFGFCLQFPRPTLVRGDFVEASPQEVTLLVGSLSQAAQLGGAFPLAVILRITLWEAYESLNLNGFLRLGYLVTFRFLRSPSPGGDA